MYENNQTRLDVDNDDDSRALIADNDTPKRPPAQAEQHNKHVLVTPRTPDVVWTEATAAAAETTTTGGCCAI